MDFVAWYHVRRSLCFDELNDFLIELTQGGITLICFVFIVRIDIFITYFYLLEWILHWIGSWKLILGISPLCSILVGWTCELISWINSWRYHWGIIVLCSIFMLQYDIFMGLFYIFLNGFLIELNHRGFLIWFKYQFSILYVHLFSSDGRLCQSQFPHGERCGGVWSRDNLWVGHMQIISNINS